ncbi:MAG: type III-B CRISPR module-associated protein Cmr5 [Methylococcaceae bacterium]
MRTRSQIYSELVYGHIQQLKQAIDDEPNLETKDILLKEAKQYGSLCHNFPLMVLRSGLSQAVAFVWVKSKGEDNTAYGKFLKHLSQLTDRPENENVSGFQQYINQAELIEYQRLTRKILSASIWYKRFAESVLGVKAGQEVPVDDEPKESDHA